MAGVKIKVTFRNEAAAVLYVNKIMDRLKKPDLNKAVNRVGKYWQKNFTSEGGMVGGWAGLAQRTIENREQQGYGAGPILFRYGALYRMSSAYFANQQGSGSRAQSTPYDKRAGHTTKASLKLGNGYATLNIAGPKVYNQWPSSNRPAREFWPFTPGLRKEARQGVVDWLVEDVILGRNG
jgi:hypothetical protein